MCVPQVRVSFSDGSALPFGLMVWSAGLAPVKFLTENNNFEKGMMGRIKVGDVVRVPGSLGSSRIISGDLG